jgi:hypothetical protein
MQGRCRYESENPCSGNPVFWQGYDGSNKLMCAGTAPRYNMLTVPVHTVPALTTDGCESASRYVLIICAASFEGTAINVSVLIMPNFASSIIAFSMPFSSGASTNATKS